MAPIDVLCMACNDATCDFKPTLLQRRSCGKHDIIIDLKFCGICHSDLHVAAGHMAGVTGAVQYPCVPGHELAGVCIQVGDSVTKVKVGDQVGVGCLVDACQSCSSCKMNQEQKCKKHVGTYQGKNKCCRENFTVPENSRTIGGYSEKMVVDENFAIIIPEGYKLEAAGPVMCAGITMYDPMVQHGVKAGDRVGIVGLGGLGVMGLKIAKALGCKVTVISRSKAKEDFAKSCGADSFCASSEKGDMEANANSLDILINTVPSYHDYFQYQQLLDKKSRISKQILLGLHEGLVNGVVLSKLTFGRSRITGSGIGGIKATQDVMNLCAEHNIVPELEVVGCDKINFVYDQLEKSNDTGKRFVLDLATLTIDLVCNDPPPVLHDAPRMSVKTIAWEVASSLFTFAWW